MSLEQVVSSFTEHLKHLQTASPTYHVVLGSGLGSALEKIAPNSEFQASGTVKFSNVDGLCATTAPDHLGEYRFFRHQTSGKIVCFQVGRLHGFEGHSAREVVKTVLASALSGTHNFIITNAAGSLTPHFLPGSVMLIQDHVNLTGQNPLAGENPSFRGRALGSRFPDLQNAYDRALSDRLGEHLSRAKLVVNQGIYLGLLGPSFETPAEIGLFSKWGLHAVGMSTVWEVTQLKHVGARVAGLSLITNMGCGLTSEKIDHVTMMKNTEQSAQSVIRGLFTFLAEQLNERNVS